MTDLPEFRRVISRWSDGPGLERATELAERHRALLPRRLTTAQLSGLHAIAQAATSPEQVVGYAQHQEARAGRIGRLDVKAFWEDLHQYLEKAGREATSLMPVQQPMSRIPNEAAWLRLSLIREFIQHLLAHSLYLGAQ